MDKSFWLTRVLFIRALGFILAVAFLVSYYQNEMLIGEKGLTPAIRYCDQVLKNFINRTNGKDFVDDMIIEFVHFDCIVNITCCFANCYFTRRTYRLINVGKMLKVNVLQNTIPEWYHSNKHKIDVFLSQPSLFWFFPPTNKMLSLTSQIGLTLSLFIVWNGSANFIIFFIIWILYFSIVSVGQTWFSFGWESQLLETTFLAMFSVPFLSIDKFPKYTPTPWVRRYLALITKNSRNIA